MNRKNNNEILAVVIAVVVILSLVLVVAVSVSSGKNKNTMPKNGFERDKAVKKENTHVIQEEVQEQNENVQGEESTLPKAEEPKAEEPEETEPEQEEPVIDTPDDTQEPTEEVPVPEQPAVSDVDGDWNLVLANPWNKLPEDFTVQLADIAGGHRVDARIVDDLDAMMKDMAKDGCSAFVCSSYRTHSKQTTLYNNEVADYLSRGYSEEDAAVEAAKWVAIPGTSEHQTGLAVDIMSNHYLVLDEGQEDTAEQKWLMENSWKYGFILRYPSDKSDITGIYYEPWHYRYVGKTAAKEIYEKGICLEEYLLG